MQHALVHCDYLTLLSRAQFREVGNVGTDAFIILFVDQVHGTKNRCE